MAHPHRDQLVVQYSAHDVELSDADKDAFEADLPILARIIEPSPSAELHVEVRHQPRSGEWKIKTELLLANNIRLFAAEVAEQAQPAFKACVRRLVAKVEAFKEGREDRTPRDRSEVPGREVWPAVAPDLDKLRDAAADGDYDAFRDAIASYRESLRKRIGRRIELHPDAAARLGDGLDLEDVVEEVFLTAFDRFDHRPTPPEGLGEWLETLIDDAIRAMVEQPEERRNISFLRSARGAGRSGEAGA